MAQPDNRSAARTRFDQMTQRASQSRQLRVTANWLRDAWAALLVVVLAIAIGVGALINPGVEKTDLRLNEGAVYVQNQGRALIGSLNYQIDSIALATSVGDQQSTLLQEGNFVLVNNAGSSTLQIYDPATNTMSSPVTPPTGAQFSMNAGKLAVTNPENGRVWYGAADELARSDFQSSATLNTDDFGQAVVTSSGDLIGLNVQESKIVRLDGSEVKIPFELDSSTRSADLSAVGEKAVVLDRTSQQLWIEGSRQPITVSGGSEARLAPPAESAAAGGRRAQAIYATQAGLIAVVDGKPTSLSGKLDSTPITPVVIGECVYGAFGGRFVKVCNGGEPKVISIPELPGDATLQFLVNRDNVVLQDVKSGRSWLVDKDMKIVDNWDEIVPETEDRQNDPNPPDDRVTLPDRTKPNRPPVAQDDPNLGARVGRSTILPILDNDSDEDGDLLTLVAAPQVDGASLQVTGDGSGLQITLPEEAKGSYRFAYEITDGRGGFASATATVTALPADPKVANQKPVNIRQNDSLIMSSGTTASKRVLVNWRDPDGDDLVLVNARPETDESEDEVTFTADGTVTFRDVGKTTGPKRVRIWVSDGTVEVEGYLNVDVRKRGSAPPIANGDFVSTMVGREVLVRPLLNDEGNNLTLTEVDPSTPAYTVVANYAENEFRFRSNTAGVYYVQYKVSNGPVSVGLVRIDVQPSSDQNNPPVAVRDVALVPFGGSVVVDPLLNDTDADNDVLVVQSVSQHPALRVVMRDRHLLTISSVHHSDEPIALTYWVSDGRNSTPGTIMVYPAPPAGSHAPRAYNDSIKARAGTIVSVPVLRNDVSPVGLDLELVRLPGDPQNAWIDGDVVRVRIPATEQAGTRQITYEVQDTSLRRTSAVINMSIISQDAQNEAPQPPLVEARVLAGSQTKIPISLLGIDPNGDSVRLLGLGSGPRLGRVTDIAEGWMRYEAYPDARGTDSFRYQVIDSFGAIGTGEIRVGVAPRTENNLPPTGVPDEVTVRPDSAVTIPVLANDYDVDGDSFTFATDRPVEMPFPIEVVDGQFLAMRAPREEGDFVGKYYIQDARGAQGNGSVYLHVQKDAPAIPPVANDDQLQVNDILGKDWVQADVLANDYDIDGTRDQLTLSLPDSPPSDAVVQDGKLSVKVKNEMQQVRYQVTDGDGQSAFAVLLVPGFNDSVPVLVDPAEVHEVVAGEVLTINLDTMVRGTGGRSTRLTTSEAVSATKGQVSLRANAIDFRADVRYAGPASVVFEVTDAAGPEDTTGKRAFLTVLIDVKPAPEQGKNRDSSQDQLTNLAPVGPSRIELQVGAGEPAELFNIRPQFSDPEGDNFNFDSWQIDSSEGLTISVGVGNDTFTAKAGVTNKGAMATMHGRVFDVVGASREVTVVVRAIGSTRPLPVAQTDVVPDAAAGRTSSVPVLLNDRSYLVDNPDLKLLAASVMSGAGTASVEGDEVKVTPSADSVGPMVVRYTIVDATNDPDRQVDGQIQLTVRSRPDPPGTPVPTETGDGYVWINWTSGDPNGSPVISRKVTAISDRFPSVTVDTCETNTCQISGLRNGVPWTFVVTESNEFGESQPSAPSSPATPDVKPDPVQGVSASFVKGSPGTIRVSWTDAPNRGSEITEFRVSVASGPGREPVAVQGASAREAVVTGLQDGVSYTFIVQSKNAKDWSDASAPSNEEHPSPPPSPPLNVQAADTEDALGGKLRVSWDRPEKTWNDNVEVYRVIVTPTNGGAPMTRDVPGNGETAYIVDGVSNRVGYSARVIAITRGGESEPSAPSPETRASGAPKQQPSGSVHVTGPYKISVSVANENKDFDVVDLELVDTQSGAVVAVQKEVRPGSSAEFAGRETIAAGRTYAVRGRPGSASNFGPKWGPESSVAWIGDPVVPYGTPELENVGVIPENEQQLRFFAAIRSDQGIANPILRARKAGSSHWETQTAGSLPALKTDGRPGQYEFQLCDPDLSKQNCSAIMTKSFAAPMTASARQSQSFRDTMAVEFADLYTGSNFSEIRFSCSINGKQGTPGQGKSNVFDFPQDAAPAGQPVNMRCDVTYRDPGLRGLVTHHHNVRIDKWPEYWK